MSGLTRNVDVSYEALVEELKKHGPEVEAELYHLLEARSRKNSARSSSDDDSQSSFKDAPD